MTELPAAHEFERRAAKAHDYEGNLTGYYIDADTWREIRALITRTEGNVMAHRTPSHADGGNLPTAGPNHDPDAMWAAHRQRMVDIHAAIRAEKPPHWTDFLPIRWVVGIAIGSFVVSFAASFIAAWVTR